MFNSTNGGYSLSDIAAVSGANRGYNNDGGFGGNGAWWIIILFLFVFCGWGDGNGFGNGRGNNSGGGNGYMPVLTTAASGALTRSDLCQEMNFSDVESGIRGLQNGLCSLGYDQLAQINGVNSNIAAGFAGVNNAVCTLGYQTQAGINSVNVAGMQNTNAIQGDINAMNIANMQNQNALQRQIADCCCENRAATKDVQYALATNTCAINTTASNNTRDIIDSQNASTRAILDAIQQGKIDAMQDKIAALTAQNQTLQFQASQAAQNSYLVDQLRPCPVPAYTVPNPFATYVPYGGCGCAA